MVDGNFVIRLAALASIRPDDHFEVAIPDQVEQQRTAALLPVVSATLLLRLIHEDAVVRLERHGVDRADLNSATRTPNPRSSREVL